MARSSVNRSFDKNNPGSYRPFMLDVGEVKRRRKAAGLTLQEATDLAGMTNRQQWHRIEAGIDEPDGIRIRTLNALARALKCDVKDLLK